MEALTPIIVLVGLVLAVGAVAALMIHAVWGLKIGISIACNPPPNRLISRIGLVIAVELLWFAVPLTILTALYVHYH